MAKVEEQRLFRSALGAFATGVTIATTTDPDEIPIGVTASSFNSVSVDPPLVLWSLAKSSHSHAAFCSSGHFAVHVLAATQEELSNQFARSGSDKFAGLGWRRGRLGSPIFDEYAARFECRVRHQYEGGDHVILVGEVVEYEARDVAPLLFHGGHYAERRAKGGNADAEPSVDLEHGSFTDDFLFYLISRAHFQTSEPARRLLADLSLSMSEYLTLVSLSMDSPLTEEEIKRRLDHTGHAPGSDTVVRMVEKDLLVRDEDSDVRMSPQGREYLLQTLAASKAREADLAGHFGPGEISDFKQMLRRIIELTGSDVPIDWRSQA